ncbi:MAG: hypothetical protein AUK34_02850 [Ignavibacteria bacterium CG2_30_36_16]|nr:hypothetical protein [Ignavibacteria bacterium]OIP62766.1 MAG: hypothetical protein AUK34_02850 [Ignavibacteria bacterium CG2_30_36_16]PJA99452.1 MAG: hypothetical protein CO127_10505 [Ignavibacteria bacterium CG_4_9_14_3_um_filter_36_18]
MKIKYWIYVTVIASTIIFIILKGAPASDQVLMTNIFVQMNSVYFYSLRFLYISSLVMLPTLTFYLFLKEFVYKNVSKESLPNIAA